MGRIAEALKKAELERQRNLRQQSPADLGLEGVPLPDSLAGESGRFVRPQPAIRVGEPERQRGRYRSGRSPLRTRAVQAGPPPPWDVHPIVVAAHDRTCTVTEQYRAARTWLLRRNTTGKRSCIAITSSVPREGKSVTTANLSVVMAEVRHMNVLTVDCDFRQGSLAKMFRLPNSPGFSDVLAGRATLDEAISQTPLGNLSFLPAGTCGDINPSELLNSTQAANIFDEIRERFHYTLVDTPPVQWLADVGVIGALCSGIVMVVRMNKTAAHLARQSLHWLQANNLEVLGCIAADCSGHGTRYEYVDNDDD